MSDPNTISIQLLVDRFLEEQELHVSPPARCPYLPDRDDQVEYLVAPSLNPAVYEALMNRGFRRNGTVVYRPVCVSCQACQAIRVPVGAFRPSRSMRRVRGRNGDVTVTCARPETDAEKLVLFRRYLEARHDGTMTGSPEEFEEFLYTSPVSTIEFQYRLGQRLIGVSLADRGPRSLSSVYMYFDPEYAERSLGSFSILWEIEFCVSAGLPYYYLGFYVAGSRTMAYKARYRPCEVLRAHRHWVAPEHEAWRVEHGE